MRIFLFLLMLSALYSEKIQIGNEILNVEIAKTYTERARGLMGRESLNDGEGMLFVYPKAERLVFWMKNTLIPLSVGFFDEKKILLQILDMDLPIGNELIKYRSRARARFALEVPQGWFESHHINPGMKFSFLDSNISVK